MERCFFSKLIWLKTKLNYVLEILHIYISSILRAFQKCCWHSDLGNTVYSSWLLWKVEKILKCDRLNTINNNITKCLVNTLCRSFLQIWREKRLIKRSLVPNWAQNIHNGLKRADTTEGAMCGILIWPRNILELVIIGEKTNP